LVRIENLSHLIITTLTFLKYLI